MLSALALQVWLMYSSTLVSSYCIADFCLPKCPIKLPKLNDNEKVQGQFAEIQSSDLAPDTHCFIRMEPPKSPVFFKFSDFNSTRSFAQVSWNYRGQDKIEELNSFVLDASISNWKPVVDSGFESAEGNDFNRPKIRHNDVINVAQMINLDFIDSQTGEKPSKRGEHVLVEIRRRKEDNFNILIRNCFNIQDHKDLFKTYCSN